MMRLLCNGVVLDLYENTKLQFKKKNTLFAFGDMSSERTTQFKLPCTPNNDRAFSLARIPAYKGDAMRKRFDAQLQTGLIVTNGFLYVSEFDGKDYSAVFVGGLAYDLKAWNNSKWGELLLPMDYGDPSISETYNANDADIPMIARVKYHFDNEDNEDFGDVFMGSIHIEQLFQKLTEQNLFKITGLVGSNIRLIRNDIYKYEDVLERLANIRSDPSLLNVETREQVIRVIPSYFGANVIAFAVGSGTKITFPENTPENLCIVYYKYSQYAEDEVRFIGTRKFDYDTNGVPYYYGKPLAGQTVLISEIGDREFLLMDASGAHRESGPGVVPMGFNFDDGGMGNVPTYDLRVRVSNLDEESENNIEWRINDHSMLTDLSLGDLVKAYAAVTGRLVCMRREGSIEFVNDFGANNVELKRIESRKNVARTFSNFGQRNYVQFKSNGAVEDWEKIRDEYTIENVNIEEEKTILTLEYIEGGQYPEQVPPFNYLHPLQPIPDNCIMYIRDTKEGFWGFNIPADTIAFAGNEMYLQRVAMPKINLLQDLCDKSTRHKIRARMTYMQYNAIDGDTTLLVDGTRYTWIEANYGDGTAEITLQKIE